MKFEFNPKLIVSVQEWEILDKALKLCRDMDAATTYDEDTEFEDGHLYGCDICPKRATCSRLAKECVFTTAHKALKEIIDMAVIK